MKRPRVLIADYKDAGITVFTPGLFKNAGCTVEVFCSPDSWLLKNKSWDVWHEASNKNSLQYASTLESLVAREHFDWVVLADDQALRVMSDATGGGNAIAQKVLPLSKNECRDLIGSKIGLSRLSRRYGIITPDFAVFNDADDLLSLAHQVSFPLILKVDKSGGGKGIFFCSDEQALLQTLHKMSVDQKINLVLQKYIRGENIAVEALYKNGVLVAYASSVVLENMNSEFGVSMLRHYREFDGLEDILRHIGMSFGIDGFSSMTFILASNSQQFYFIEADLRTHAWFYLAKFCGVDFSMAIRRYLAGDITSQPLSNKVRRTIPHFHRQLRWLLRHRNFSGIKKWCCDKKYRPFIPCHDLKILWSILSDVGKSSLYDYAAIQPLMRAGSRLVRRVRIFSLFLNKGK